MKIMMDTKTAEYKEILTAKEKKMDREELLREAHTQALTVICAALANKIKLLTGNNEENEVKMLEALVPVIKDFMIDKKEEILHED